MDVFSNYKAKLGEGPVYDFNSIYWVDIEGKKIIIKNLDDKNEKIIEVPDMVSSLCVIDENRVLATIRHTISLVNIQTKEIKEIVSVEVNISKNTFNDGKCDPKGRFWAGTMNTSKDSPSGNLYRFDKELKKMLSNLTVSNGLAWDLDRGKMYLIDSPIRKVYSFDYDVNTGDIYNKEVFIDFSTEKGNPDGMTIDEEGYLWIAHWGGGKVSRWSPNGKKVSELKLPVTYVTSVTFGEEDLDTLFITTANKEDEPLSGKLFYHKVNTKGTKSYRFSFLYTK
ncbi:SMP-30/gluconolactonase/LRE family protein [Sulfurisphaera javensis]|uniref:SMP-30/gluconolactonase/LRE family protein n=1 Tax=Sulfurisphaera javensis TaxID=2049879 RepID=A0AAT9GQA6_9CREN